ncbi:MAG TPA: hypothetical protein VLX59_13405 [Acidimicrobiales bacterium]|nr:hypothetical protein [Acidimicrobiales bacterium]
MDDGQVEALLEQLDRMLAQVETMPGPEGRVARDAVAALSQVYGEALARAVELAGVEEGRAMAGDELVGHLLALHGIHPEPAAARAAQALAQVQATLHGRGSVALADVHDGVARVEISGGGCGSTDLAAAVTEVLLGEAPDLAGVETVPAGAFVPLDSLRRRPARSR